MAHNEGANIGNLLAALVSQKTTSVTITEIIVVASGCTDDTQAIVDRWSNEDPRIHLLAQPVRGGKASAVNTFIRSASDKILVLCSADLLPHPDTIENLVLPFEDPEVGITSARPVPVNSPNHFTGFAAHLLWSLHDAINRRSFKAGELLAFRRVFERIPADTPVDEACIEPVIRGQGYSAFYVPTAVVFNKGPDHLAEFLAQRRRIYAGHLALRRQLGYKVSTLSSWDVSRIAANYVALHPETSLWSCGVFGLEALARLMGWMDYVRARDYSVWPIAASTKQLSTNYCQPCEYSHAASEILQRKA
jgi:cellulose synthase/poly-beta-1,6-N-acetylglucosamine synthase-like glycosyltransferase